MLAPVEDHVAECREIGRAVVSGVVVSVCGREHHPRCPHEPEHIVRPDREADGSPGTVTPGGRLLVLPAPVAQMEHRSPVRPSAALTPPLRAAETGHRQELWPVDRVEEAVLASDRHGRKLPEKKAEAA